MCIRDRFSAVKKEKLTLLHSNLFYTFKQCFIVLVSLAHTCVCIANKTAIHTWIVYKFCNQNCLTNSNNVVFYVSVLIFLVHTCACIANETGIHTWILDQSCNWNCSTNANNVVL